VPRPTLRPTALSMVVSMHFVFIVRVAISLHFAITYDIFTDIAYDINYDIKAFLPVIKSLLLASPDVD
jgi:hypothetical protein